ncbi:alpha/beta hydrolase [Cryptosporangium aurantiacum]|uniref:Lysophospholipase, alpha-beta hydrolase superfamily n=1 Tax=Cryptosporangium aurantiacum TaxID=134849 RepID=A0A1M7PFC5_9ACTN|nr:alpha/beta fold hydrolase [Cryptosporangium aurantiacum]SHN15675.1 Lysophospholipase, alpha-beta hydrolase superfamily [Cryptosporangium aurantiacum]
MAPQELVFDVTGQVGAGGTLTQAAWLFTPPEPQKAVAALLCLAGGTYDKRYWHLEVPGHPGYSFAEHLAGQGYLVIALDHLGVGDSSDPTSAGPVGLELLARGDAAVAAQLTERLRAGTLADGLPPLTVPLIGVGHSMGSCLTTMVQATAGAYDAVVLLGYGVQIANVYEETTDATDLAARIEQSEAIFRKMNGVESGEVSCVVPRGNLHHIFHAPDVPPEVIAADDAAESRVPVRAASEVTTPGYVQRYAAQVDVPVFLGLGAGLDVSPDPHLEPGGYRATGDIEVYLVPGSHHCHNFASERRALWNRIAAWVPTVTRVAV